MMSQTSWHFARQTAFAVLTLAAIEKDYSLPTYDTNYLDSAMHSILTATRLMALCPYGRLQIFPKHYSLPTYETNYLDSAKHSILTAPRLYMPLWSVTYVSLYLYFWIAIQKMSRHSNYNDVT